MDNHAHKVIRFTRKIFGPFCLLGVLFSVSLPLRASADEASIGNDDYYQDLVFAIPDDSEVEFGWVLPPLEFDATDGRDLHAFDFMVDDDGKPWLSYSGDLLVDLVDGYKYRTSRPFNSIVFMEDAGPLLADDSSLWYIKADDGIRIDGDDYVEASLMPLFDLPIPSARIFAGEGNSVYLTGWNAETGLYEVYLLKPEEDGLITSILFNSDRKIYAVTGGENDTYAAVGRRITRFSHADSTFTAVAEHPTESINQLNYSQKDGLFFATKSSVGYVNSEGTAEFILTSNPQIDLNQGKLYVFLPESFGIIGIDNVKELQEDNLVTAETEELIGIDRAAAMAALELDSLGSLYRRGTLGKLTEDERFTENPELRSILVQRLQELSREKIEYASDSKSKDLDDANKLLTFARRIIEKHDMETETPEVYFNLGLLAVLRGNENEGIKYFNRFLDYSKYFGDRADAVERIARLKEAKEEKRKEREKKRSRFSLGFSWANGKPRGVLKDVDASPRPVVIVRFRGPPLARFGYGFSLDMGVDAVIDIKDNPLPDFPEGSYRSFNALLGLSFRANQTWTGQYFDGGLGYGMSFRGSEESEGPADSYFALSSGYGGGLLFFVSDRVSFDFGYHIFKIYNEGKHVEESERPKRFNDDYYYLSAGIIFFIG